MATLNRFQRYSKQENTVTNNILLMLSSIYDIDPNYYEQYIQGVTEDSEYYKVMPMFHQQVGGKNQIADGHIKVEASSIIIETKIDGLEWVNKLVKYADMFEKYEAKILFHLSSERYDVSKIEHIKKILADKGLVRIRFHSLTYQDLVDQLKVLLDEKPHDISLRKLSDDFESYCLDMGLVNKSKHMLRAMACGQSFDLNVKHQFYFDLAQRGYSSFNYLGIYSKKSVRFIAEIENVIEADFIDEKLAVWNSKYEVTGAQQKKVIRAIKDSNKDGWKLSKDHRFFLLKNFCETDFRKLSPGGIYRVRYFDLEHIFEGDMPPNIEGVAERLRSHTWE